jgi:hypothetical protein
VSFRRGGRVSADSSALHSAAWNRMHSACVTRADFPRKHDLSLSLALSPIQTPLRSPPSPTPCPVAEASDVAFSRSTTLSLKAGAEKHHHLRSRRCHRRGSRPVAMVTSGFLLKKRVMAVATSGFLHKTTRCRPKRRDVAMATSGFLPEKTRCRHGDKSVSCQKDEMSRWRQVCF